jgi:predicted nucleic acid-binding protein
MASKPAVMIDINIILDVLQKREGFFEASAQLLAAVETKKVNGYLSAHSITTLFYIIRKEKSILTARETISKLLSFIKIATVDQTTIEQALRLEYQDFEDAVQMAAAIQCKADCLITRNVKDYRLALIPVMQPVDFIGTLVRPS